MMLKQICDFFCLCQIDYYLGLPNFIRYDTSKNFMNCECKQFASSIAIITCSIPVEMHWSIDIVKKYHAVLHRAYQIIVNEGITKKEIAL